MNRTRTLDLFNGTQLRDAGIRLASENAEVKQPGWNEDAYSLLKDFIKTVTGDFLCEDFRKHCEAHNLKAPPSLRAYGSIIVRAAKEGLIKKTGYRNVTNAKAHATPATTWIKN